MKFDTPYHNWCEFVQQVVMPLHLDDAMNPASEAEKAEAQRLWDEVDDHYLRACLFIAYNHYINQRADLQALERYWVP